MDELQSSHDLLLWPKALRRLSIHEKRTHIRDFEDKNLGKLEPLLKIRQSTLRSIRILVGSPGLAGCIDFTEFPNLCELTISTFAISNAEETASMLFAPQLQSLTLKFGPTQFRSSEVLHFAEHHMKWIKILLYLAVERKSSLQNVKVVLEAEWVVRDDGCGLTRRDWANHPLNVLDRFAAVFKPLGINVSHSGQLFGEPWREENED